MRISSFNYLMKQGFSSIWKNGMLSFASFCIMMVSLLMVGMSALTSININSIIDKIADKNEVVVVIEDGTTDEQISQMKLQLDNIDNIKEIKLYSKDEAWENLTNNLTQEEKSLFQYADTNPLPDTYRVKIDDISLLDVTTNEISKIENIDRIESPSDFADILLNIRKIVRIISSSLIAALIVVSMVIISNTTRASVYTRRKEINIMKYVGATNTFIKIPFFVEGMIIGLIAAFGAVGITKLIYDAFFDLFQNNVLIMSILGRKGIIPFNDIFIYILIGYIIAGVVIGAFGTVFSTRKHLKV